MTLAFTADGPGFAQMVRTLRGLKLEEFRGRVESLDAKRKQIQLIREVKKSYLKNDERLKTLACVLLDDEYCGKVIKILSTDLPLWNFGIDECWNEEGDLFLQIDPQGLNYMSGDDVDEFFSDISGLTQENSLNAFLTLLNYDVLNNDEQWMECIEHFGWPFEEPVGLSYMKPFDRVFLRRYLKKEKIEALYPAAELAFFAPANVFFDGCNEDPDTLFIPFEAGNINLLKKEWKKAQVILDKFEPAVTLVAKNPAVLRPFFEGMRMSQI